MRFLCIIGWFVTLLGAWLCEAVCLPATWSQTGRSVVAGVTLGGLVVVLGFFFLGIDIHDTLLDIAKKLEKQAPATPSEPPPTEG